MYNRLRDHIKLRFLYQYINQFESRDPTRGAHHDSESCRWFQKASGINVILESGSKLSLLFLYILVNFRKTLRDTCLANRDQQGIKSKFLHNSESL